MFGIAWTELLIIGIVALVIIPPKDLPGALRAVGKWVGQMRRMAFDFQHQVTEALREADIDDVKKSVADLTSLYPLADVRKELESATAPMTMLEGQIRHDLESVQADLNVPQQSYVSHDPHENTIAAPDEAQPAATTDAMDAPFPEIAHDPAPVDLSDLQPESQPTPQTVDAAATVAAHPVEPVTVEPLPAEPLPLAPATAGPVLAMPEVAERAKVTAT